MVSGDLKVGVFVSVGTLWRRRVVFAEVVERG